MRTIGLDWGEKRIGVAVSDPMGIFAMPLCTINVTSEKKAISDIRDIVNDKEADAIIIGVPVNMNGTQGPMFKKVDDFISKLTNVIKIKVIKIDERMSSMAADRSLKEFDMDNRKRKVMRDRVAAQVILQGYLDSVACSEEM